jgi:hypothetical protein
MENITQASHTQLYVSRETGELVVVAPQRKLTENFLDSEEFTRISQMINMDMNFLPDEPATIDLKAYFKTTNLIRVGSDGKEL